MPAEEKTEEEREEKAAYYREWTAGRRAQEAARAKRAGPRGEGAVREGISSVVYDGLFYVDLPDSFPINVSFFILIL